MIKNNKWKLLISSIIILLPMLAGVLLWNRLPDSMAVHWGTDGTADGWQSKAFAVFGLPIILLALQWLCVLVTAKDPKNKGQNKKAISMVLWIVPVVSLFASGVIYGSALGLVMEVARLAPALIGVMFLVLGNYLPKCKQNHTIGIKIPWTLADEENWNKTHRLSGKLWVIGGLVILFTVFLPGDGMYYVMLAAILIMAIVPIVYSYYLHHKK